MTQSAGQRLELEETGCPVFGMTFGWPTFADIASLG